MLDLQKESLMKLSKDKVVNKYMSEIIRVNKDPKFIEYMSYEEDQRKRLNTMLRKSKEEGEELGEKRGEKRGRTLGITEGYKNANKENAYKMREEGIPISIIQRVTGISL
jgi:predicted transposase YdaD